MMDDDNNNNSNNNNIFIIIIKSGILWYSVHQCHQSSLPFFLRGVRGGGGGTLDQSDTWNIKRNK